jgi:hypothetical protein
MVGRSLIRIGGVALALALWTWGTCLGQTLPPAAHHANTLVANPFPDHPELTPTLVSLNLLHADVSTALNALAAAAHCTCTIGKPPPNGWPATVDLVVKDDPVLDAMLQIQSQAGVYIFVEKNSHLRVQYPLHPLSPGAWCVSGPFAFVVSNISRTVSLDAVGHPYVIKPNIIADPIDVGMSTLVEPKILVKQLPSHLDYIQIDDENGNSLIPPNIIFNGPGTRLPGWFEISADYQLSYPATNPGKTIKRFSATSHNIVQLKSEQVTINDPTAATRQKDLTSINVTFSQPVWDPQWKQFTLDIVYDAEKITDANWKALVKELPLLTPTVQGDPAVRFQVQHIEPPLNSSAPATAPAGQFTVSYEIIVSPGKGQNVDFTIAPAISSITIDVPTIAEVNVPVEFHDLPLP